jgi:hypothetical protein
LNPFSEDLRVARALRAAALSVDGVHSMGSGIYAEAATYGAGEKVTGVVVSADEVRLYVVAAYPSLASGRGGSVLSVAKKVREAATPAAKGREVSLIIEDLGPAPGKSPGATVEAVLVVGERR